MKSVFATLALALCTLFAVPACNPPGPGPEPAIGAYIPPVQHVTTAIPLATIQAQTSGVAFNVGSTLPTNARLLGAEVTATTAITGGTISAATATLQGGTDSAGSLIASTSVFTGGPALFATGGSNPYLSRGGQQLKMTLSSTGDTLAHATAGVLAVDVFYIVVP